ncbi:Intracellular septation protein [Tritonibacter multivorans]|uniref:Inner membrane-spanning protein YciB n=1 Tax=Tritonibacter multivorans TaxID=928856 RepID=A0A0P1G927_9RHOB|nr:inner membrane-spanning protein YciB [Tritonibacter multivorans]MDA7421734.1 septation protein IspZ [Tritonibacter multivorans]CUH78005.1 Intracellular septation protein [Tritonibacter multivorans]SFD04153.1 intracellular septation protein [Tritonibacter multivorans]
MAEQKKINPMVKTLLELGPVVLFFVAYLKLKDEVFQIAGTDYAGFIVVTAAFVPLMVASTLVLWRLTGVLSKMQVLTLVMIVLFGGLSVWFNDERFFKMKPTMIYLMFGGIIGFGLLRGESYLRVVMEEMMPLQPEGWMILTRRMCAFFFALAVANEAIWRTQSTDTWVYFKTFGLTAAMFVFFMAQGKLFSAYGIEEDGASEDG